MSRAQVCALLHGRVRQHVYGLDAGDDDVLRRLAGPRRLDVSASRHLLFSRQGHLLSLSLHLAARHAAPLPLRSVDELWLEVPVADGDPESDHHGDGRFLLWHISARAANRSAATIESPLTGER